ncbi:putative tubulin-specific chaperone A [Paratrimastix pyriformis]|uniref:Tubulin-specific chaperone A n=1 Tax=Paratrimastix pyriformis TaxID=342808 RepID=A0ABQ8UT26_9EUKA|nr:putative tubulin-specific chaperone A [Paratrimastix pyriformis]
MSAVPAPAPVSAPVAPTREDPALRPLKIKTGVCTRIIKEATSYQHELAAQTQKVERMRASGVDASDVKKQMEVLADTRQMLPDCKRRLEAAHQDLAAAMGAVSEALRGSATYEAATQTAANVERFLREFNESP